jgi:Putative methyltransferase
MTVWQRWHEDYDDPSSELARRLVVVQERIARWADAAPEGARRLISLCAGQGRDVAGALARHPRRDDISGLLVELDPVNVAAADARLMEAGLRGVRVARGDAGVTTAYAGAVPADLVLACGVLGNVEAADVRRTISVLPRLCAPGATVIWTRHRREPDLTPTIRRWFRQRGFTELDFTSPGPGRWSVGTHRYEGEPKPFQPGLRLFSFVR